MQAKEDMNFRMAHAKRGDLLAHDMASGDLAALLADPVFAQHYVQADPLFILGTEPLRLAFANAAACSLFGSRQIAKMQHNLLAGQGLASKRIVYLAQALPMRPNGQLERMRVMVGRLPETLMLSCRKIQAPSGKIWCLFAGVGVRPALLNPIAPLSAEAKPVEANSPGTAPVAAREIAPVPLPETAAETSHGAVSHVLSKIMQSEGAAPQPEPEPADDISPAPVDPVQVSNEVRFNWRSDKAHVIQHVSPEWLHVLDVPESAIVGRSFADIEREFAVEPAAHITQALERQVTWSGLETHWKVKDPRFPEAMQRVLTFVIGGVPIFKPPHDFIGTRGYGILQGEQFLPSAPLPPALLSAPETGHGTEIKSASADEAPAPATHVGGEANRLSED
ncbi:MAG: hypothetical protein KGJ29_14290, partial [Hyphomicrobiales bacterium]|nr:hypothetical protein [Hyphomicrobiales bacterium]